MTVQAEPGHDSITRDARHAGSTPARWRLWAADQMRVHEGPRALATTAAFPLAFGPPSVALRVVDRYLRFNPEGMFAGAAWRRALALARHERVRREPVKLDRSIILKAPDRATGERGLLLTSFEPQLARLARAATLEAITEWYDVAFLPTWQPFYSIPLFQFVARARRPMLMMPSSASDFELCRRRHRDMDALPFQASSWINPAFYTPAARKDIDIVMVANFGTYKRHWHLFRALRDLPRDLRVVLVGVPMSGRTADTLRAEARAFGTEDRFEIQQAPPDAVVADLLARARMFLALSAREGSYISMAEALFSDTPVGVYRNAVIGSKDYVNEHTGVQFDPGRPLAPQLLRMLEESSRFTPRAWATAHIAASVNSRRLDELLRARAAARGEAWTREVPPFYCRHFDFHYEHDADAARLAPTYREFEQEFGVAVTRPS